MAFTKIKVIIADDHAILRKGLIQILEEEHDISVVGEAKDGNEAIQLTAKMQCDVLLLDISMPDKSGIEVIKIVRNDNQKLPILMLSMHREDQYAIRCLKAGASGYLSKQSASTELVKAIRTVATGKKYISAEVAQILANHVNVSEDTPIHELLSDREFQTLTMIGSGLTVTEIGDKLALSVKTVSVYRARILEKMQMRNNSDLMNYVIKNNLIIPE
jgi:DNA-binding NarL/FixJ family response regulator